MREWLFELSIFILIITFSLLLFFTPTFVSQNLLQQLDFIFTLITYSGAFIFIFAVIYGVNIFFKYKQIRKLIFSLMFIHIFYMMMNELTTLQF